VGAVWYVAVIDALVNAGADDEVADAIRTKLQEGDTYLRQVRVGVRLLGFLGWKSVRMCCRD
jgi:hypothetical protein